MLKKFSSLPMLSLAIIISFLMASITPAPVLAQSKQAVSLTGLQFVANIETVGVAVSGVNLPNTADLLYRQAGETIWHSGHPLLLINDGRLIGSLFGLAAGTTYEVKVRAGASEISGTVNTQLDEIQFAPATILHVDGKAALGGDGSISAPFKKIQEAINHAGPGTQILVADGIYREAVTFPASGIAGNWIQLKAEGSGAILDGARILSGAIWTLKTTNVWYTKITTPISYLARGINRFYLYDNLTGLLNGLGHNNVPMSEGWYWEQATSTLYVRSLNDPAKYAWRVPLLNDAIDTNGQDWLWIEGFEIRFYGAQYSGCGICLTNASHVVIRKNKIHNLQLGIFINWTGGDERGNDTRIEYNDISDPPMNAWPWKATKATSMEGTGIVLRGRTGAIVRGNAIHNFFNGIYSGSSGDLQNSALAFDADIYNNHIYYVSDDAFEPEGACINQRFRNNTVENMLVGVSLAPVTKGPVWVLRSTFFNYTGRSIKLDRGSSGIVLYYHNTSWTQQPNANAVDVISPAHNTTLHNNIFQGKSFIFRETVTGSSGNDWNNDDLYTTYSPRYKWENISYASLATLCSAAKLECKGYEHAPGLTDPAAGNFALLSSSPNIDRGALIPGINDDFSGNAPDIGAYEFASNPPVNTPPAVLSVTRADTNPTSAASVNFTVTFSEPVSGADATDFSLVSTIADAAIIKVTSVSTSTYTVNVNTGTSDGTIHLDVADNDSILDTAGNPLGGVGRGNGNFSAGETYTVNKSTAQTVTVTFNSIGTQDGWILESGEFSNKGGSFDRISTTLQIGDDNQDRQYKSILSFVTDSLPDNAVIITAQLMIKKQGVVGTSPLSTHGSLLAEISSGGFSGSVDLTVDDFSAPAGTGSVQQSFSIADPLYTINLGSINLAFINKTGATQFRLFFAKDDNDDLSANYLKIYSGNAGISDQPQLIITYSIP